MKNDGRKKPYYLYKEDLLREEFVLEVSGGQITTWDKTAYNSRRKKCKDAATAKAVAEAKEDSEIPPSVYQVSDLGTGVPPVLTYTALQKKNGKTFG